MIITRTPFRISFFGGGTDYPIWFRRHGGAVLATTIDKYCYISCRRLPPFFEHRHRIVYSQIENVSHSAEIKHPSVRATLTLLKVKQGVEIHHDGDLPARSGIGSSSSFTVGLINALMALEGQHISKEALANQAIYVEQEILGEAVGSQDQISAAFGGFNRIEFIRDGSFKVNPVILPKEVMEKLQAHLMLFFTGFSRFAPEIAQSKLQNIHTREKELATMRTMVDESIELLQNKKTSLLEFGKLLHESWRYKRSLSDRVTTPEIDQIYEAALQAGASGGKILGAGGGGFILLFVVPKYQKIVLEKLRHLVHVPFSFENSGSRVIVYQPDEVG
jgi:D-glycero-alpha-D-manno-heptose-7-phosphate kinase